METWQLVVAGVVCFLIFAIILVYWQVRRYPGTIMQKLKTRWGYASAKVIGPYTGDSKGGLMNNCYYVTGSSVLGSGQYIVWNEFRQVMALQDTTGTIYCATKGGSADVYLNGELLGTFNGEDAKSQTVKSFASGNNVIAAIVSSPDISVAIGVFDSNKLSMTKTGSPWNIRFF